MGKRCSLLLICIIAFASLPMLSTAKQILPLRGIIFKRSTSDRVAQVLITNLHTKTLMVSDQLGGFNIEVNIGDTLLFTKNEFADQKIVILNTNDLIVYMQPVIKLEQVTIKGQSKQQELTEIMNEYRNKGIYNDGKSLPFWQFFNSPVSGLYQLFGRGPSQARHFQQYAKSELEHDEVHRRYTKQLVQTITKLPDDEALKFMETYTPSYEDIKTWNDYQVIMYIKRSFEFYKRNKNAARLPKLY